MTEEILETAEELPAPLEAGDEIYVGSSFYLSHGRDDFCGGRARVSKVTKGISGGNEAWFVEVEERPECRYNWEFLENDQEKFKERFGDDRAHADPDLRPEFNEW